MSPLSWLRRRDAAWRAGWAETFPKPWARLQANLDMYLVDHHFLRILWTNRAEIAPGIWRSNQPSPRQLRRLARTIGVKTVINLRGENMYGSYLLEKEACAALGIKLVDLRLYSRAAPKPEALHAFRDALEAAERPVLFHCKSGADRAGLAAAVALLIGGASSAEAARQLSLRFLHVRQAKTGILDHFIAAYKTYAAQTPIPFFDWVDTVYDRAALEAEFKANRAADLLVGGVMRRE